VRRTDRNASHITGYGLSALTLTHPFSLPNPRQRCVRRALPTRTGRGMVFSRDGITAWGKHVTKNLSKRRSLKHSLWFYRRLLEWQREAPRATPLTQRAAMWQAGFRSVSSSLYDLSPEHAHEYLPDSVRLRTYSSSKASSTLLINGSFTRGVLDDKLLFTYLLSQQLPIPCILAVVERGETFVRR
jgi:hypothetical protein